MFVMVVSDPHAAAVHLLWRDGGQRLPGKLQSTHDGLETLEGQRRTIVVQLDDPVSETSHPGETVDPHDPRRPRCSSELNKHY